MDIQIQSGSMIGLYKIIRQANTSQNNNDIQWVLVAPPQLIAGVSIIFLGLMILFLKRHKKADNK